MSLKFSNCWLFSVVFNRSRVSTKKSRSVSDVNGQMFQDHHLSENNFSFVREIWWIENIFCAVASWYQWMILSFWLITNNCGLQFFPMFSMLHFSIFHHQFTMFLNFVVSINIKLCSVKFPFEKYFVCQERFFDQQLINEYCQSKI